MTDRSDAADNCSGAVPARASLTETALERIREYLLVAPADQNALHQAGKLLYEMGRYREAAAHFDKAMSCGRCPLQQADGDASCRRAAPRGQDGVALHYEILAQLADCYLSLSDCERAERYCRAASALAPGEARPYLALGALAFGREQLDEASGFFQVAAEIEPTCAEAYGGLAIIHQQRQEHSAAFEMYLKSLELDTDNLVALLGLFQVSCEMGSFSKIIHYLEVYLAAHPEDASVRFCLAALYAKDGRLSDAQRAAEEVLEQEPEKQEALDLLVEVQGALRQADHPQKANR